ncbi:MAG: extracellular solute-binding protein, partial [Opitutaceae bacterium]
KAVRDGWMAGMRLIQLVGANSRYFTDTSQKPPIDVAAGNCAVGLCIDFYGRQQQEAVRRRNSEVGGKAAGAGATATEHGRDARDTSERVGYVSPEGGSVSSVDPVGMLRGVKNRAASVAFMEFVLSLDGQKLWSFKTGAPGGPERFALRRLPVRKDFYAHAEWKQWQSDPEEGPYAQQNPLIYRPQWTGALFREMAFIVRVMCQDTHRELASAWRAIIAAPEPAKARALAAMQDLSAVDYERAGGEIRRALGSKNKVDEVKMAKELADFFRANYARAEEMARGR